jgi:outer membrane biosynthesis protein TonB
MQKTNRISSFLKTIMYIWVAFQIVACGGGSGGSGIAAGDAGGGVAAATLADDIQIAGSVGDGPVTGATVEVWNVRGEMIGSMRSDNTASFRSRIRVRRSSYPLILKVRGGTDLVSGRAPDFQMLSVMQNRYVRQVNINPFSTLIVKIAQSLPGGLSPDNIRTASVFVMQASAYGLDTAVISDPVSAPLTDDNVANLMKASEAMGEMVRRTRDRMRAAGLQVSGSGVMDALAADMKDGRLDGRGAAGTNSRLTAVAKVVSGQVMVEALSNNLKVDGVVATSVIDEAIRITRPGVESNALTHSVRITGNALKQTLAAIAAASVVDSSAEVVGLAAVVSRIRSGASSADAATVLPADSSRAFDNSLQLVTTASQGQIDRVNTAEDLVTAAPTPQAPAPEEPAADESALQAPAPEEPAPEELAPKEPAPQDPAQPEPISQEPAPQEPAPEEPAQQEPIPQEPASQEPAPDDPAAPVPTSSGSFILQWTAPVARADGSPLSLADIDRYWIYYGTSAGNYTNKISVSNGSAQTATVSNVPTGSWYVAMSTVDTGGLESGRSAAVIKVSQ